MSKREFPDPNDELRQQLDEYGLKQVETMLALGYLGGDKWPILEWIKEKRAERDAEAEKRISEQERVAASSKRAAWIAAWTSIAGVLIGLAGIAATVLF